MQKTLHWGEDGSGPGVQLGSAQGHHELCADQRLTQAMHLGCADLVEVSEDEELSAVSVYC